MSTLITLIRQLAELERNRTALRDRIQSFTHMRDRAIMRISNPNGNSTEDISTDKSNIRLWESNIANWNSQLRIIEHNIDVIGPQIDAIRARHEASFKDEDEEADNEYMTGRLRICPKCLRIERPSNI